MPYLTEETKTLHLRDCPRPNLCARLQVPADPNNGDCLWSAADRPWPCEPATYPPTEASFFFEPK